MKINRTIFLFLVLFISIISAGFAQNKTIDSLKNELLRYPKMDSTRVDILNELNYSFYLNNIDAIQSYLDEVEDIIETIDYKKGKARHLYIKGSLLVMKGNFEVTIQYFEEALQLYQSMNLKKGISDCYDALAVILRFQSEYQSAIEYSEKALEIKEEIGNIEETAYNLYFLGGLYSTTGNYFDALQCYERAKKLFKGEDNKKGISRVFESMGVIYLEQGNYPLALEHFNKSLFLKEKYFDSVGIFSILNNIGIIYERNGDFDKSLEFYNRSLVISKKNNYQRSIVKSNLYIGKLFKKKKEYAKAFIFINKALEKSEEINDLNNVAISLNYMGSMYLSQEEPTLAYECYKKSERISLEIGKQQVLCESYWGLASTFLIEKKYEKALFYALNMKKIADELNLLDHQRSAAYLLLNIYKNTHNYKKALASHEEYKRVSDSLFNKENIQKITQLEYEYKYKQALDSASIRELQLTKTVTATNKDLEKSKQNYLLAIIGFLMVSILLGAIIFYLKFRNIKSKTKNIVIEQKLLRSQMTPHFIFNSLSVLQGMILNKEQEKSISYLSKFSKLLRIILENSRDKTVSLSQELAAVENYLALQNLENKAYNYKVVVDQSIDDSLFQIPPMLIQPFVENAIEHAFESKNENKMIDVDVKYLDDKLICIITDNGIGIDIQKVTKRKAKNSLATVITSERLKVLSKDFKIKGWLTVEDRKVYNKQGTIVTLAIPYKTRVA